MKISNRSTRWQESVDFGQKNRLREIPVTDSDYLTTTPPAGHEAHPAALLISWQCGRGWRKQRTMSGQEHYRAGIADVPEHIVKATDGRLDTTFITTIVLVCVAAGMWLMLSCGMKIARWVREDFIIPFRDRWLRLIDGLGEHLTKTDAAISTLTSNTVVQTEAMKAIAEHVTHFEPSPPVASVTIEADCNGIIKTCSSGSERLFGYQPRELIGKPFEMIISSRLVERHREAFAVRAADPRVKPGRREIPNAIGQHRDGHDVPVITIVQEIEREGEKLFRSQITEDDGLR